jgi:hypothetical protein
LNDILIPNQLNIPPDLQPDRTTLPSLLTTRPNNPRLDPSNPHPNPQPASFSLGEREWRARDVVERGLQWRAASRRHNDAARGPSIELRRSAGEQAAAAAGGAARALQRCVLGLGAGAHEQDSQFKSGGARIRSRLAVAWLARTQGGSRSHGIPSRFNPAGKKMSQKKFLSTAYLVIPLTLSVIRPSSRDYCDCI